MEYLTSLADTIVSTITLFSFLGKTTYFFKIPALDLLIERYICDVLDAPLPVIKYTVSLFLVYPFAGILKLIPYKYDGIRHFYCFIIGYRHHHHH
jgi:hypothetical protein